MNKLLNKIPQSELIKFTILISLGIFGLQILIPQYMYHMVWVILIFFFVLTYASLYIIEKVTRRNEENFLAIYFSAMIGRLFISIIFATIFILTDKANIFNFSFNFLFLYLLFLGFEIYGIITNLRLHSKKGTKDE